MLMIPMQEQEAVEDLDLHQDLLLEQHPEICRRITMGRRIRKNLWKQISSLIRGTQRRDSEFILEELVETSPHRIPDLIDQAQGAGGEDEEEKRKRKKKMRRRKNEKRGNEGG